MRRWVARLPVHRKLVYMALVVTTTALLLASAGLVALDLWRYSVRAGQDATSLAHVIAENSAAAVAFRDVDAAAETLATVRVRPVVSRACLSHADGSLVGTYDREGGTSCSPAGGSWQNVVATVPVVWNGQTIGSVYLERNLSDLWARMAVTAGAAFAMLLLSAAVASALAHRLQAAISTPIRELADAARKIGDDPQAAIPPIRAPQDEVGALVTAFSDMASRVRASNAELLEANAALRREVDERTRIEADREAALQREREASRLKDEFLAAVSHELRTPLNAIVGWVQVLTTAAANEQLTAKAIASIARNAQAQTRVIEDLVDVSRIVTGKMHLRFQVIDLRTPVQAAGDAVESLAEAKGVTFRMELPDAPCLVNGDADRIQQVVGNLLSNALKFTRPGGAVRLELCQSGGIYEIPVRDTGIGINPEFLPYVFDRFRQADGSITREHGGLGLGLAIVKELTELHGGSVQARSAGQGQGATFVIRLPQLVSAAITVARGSSDELPPLALQGLRVLAVDDHPDALDVLSIALSTAGAEVTAATSGADALAAWEDGRYDVIICDVAMPGIDGFELLRRIRNTPAGATIPAIAVTAHASAEHRARSRAAGFDEHIAKPYRNAELLQNIRQLMAGHEVRPADTGSGTSAPRRRK